VKLAVCLSVFCLLAPCGAWAGHAGDYRLVSEGCSGEMRIAESVNPDTVMVSVGTVCGPQAHLCELDACGRVTGDGRVVVEDEGGECRIVLSMEGHVARLEQEGTCGCGLRAVMSGLYVRTGVPLRCSGSLDGKYPIRMKIRLDGARVEGAYLYERYGKSLRLQGTVENHGLMMEELDENGRPTGTFRGRFVSPSRVEGTWSRPDGSKAMPFVLNLTRGS